MNVEVEYFVVINDEEQYSIWPVFREIPLGWYKEGKAGTKQECLDHIEQVWKDITPKSVREAIAAARESTPTL
ncbi:MbtH protein [Xanthomonas arboricola]|uniref:MbtH family protein n=1 Tax=Xanthomonas TaxID=338 RepID=UPI000F8E8E0F|nr:MULTISPECIES: MbtH family protein [Xanthomonas]MBB3811696.1 MbtH protein [Xanthomonas euroxanthea]